MRSWSILKACLRRPSSASCIRVIGWHSSRRRKFSHIFRSLDFYRCKCCRLNLKTIIGIYRELGEFIEAVDAEAQARGEPEDRSIDADFRSGVYLGVGSSHLILSMMPGKLLTIVELFGYKGDRKTALDYLNRIGGWSTEQDDPVPKGSLTLRP